MSVDEDVEKLTVEKEQEQVLQQRRAGRAAETVDRKGKSLWLVISCQSMWRDMLWQALRYIAVTVTGAANTTYHSL